MRTHTAGITILLVAVFGCRDSSKPPPAAEPAAMDVAQNAAQPAPETDENPKGEGFSGRHRAEAKSGWVPAEFKNGMKRFKDPGVYADGVPVGMLRFGELPVPLEPTWYEERAAIPFGPGHKGPRYKIVKQRRYKFVDYFNAIGLDVKRIKAVHLYGGSKRRAAMVVSGEQLRGKGTFTFRFGSDVRGKPIPSCSADVGDGKCPDSVGAIAVYLDRKAPTREGGHFLLDGKILKSIPYYGEPLRGGIRVYLDGPLAATIKRRKFKANSELKTTDAKGVEHWSLYGFLASQGVVTSEVTEAWVIHNGRRVKRLTGEQIAAATFVATGQRRGEILLGDDLIPTHALALHTKSVTEKDFPVILPHEQDVL